MITDDIAAISTPPGEGGIAIVRLSGSGVIGKVEKIFEPFDTTVKLSNKKGYTLTLGWITNPDGEKIDEVLIGLMRGPKSYTGEDVVEINCHGGTLAAHKYLSSRCQ
jgi:tRNA modification GTPase